MESELVNLLNETKIEKIQYEVIVNDFMKFQAERIKKMEYSRDYFLKDELKTKIASEYAYNKVIGKYNLQK